MPRSEQQRDEVRWIRDLLANKVLVFRVKKWWWRFLTLAVLLMFFFARSAWDTISILWVAYVSHAAMVATYAGAEQAAEAAAQLTDD